MRFFLLLLALCASPLAAHADNQHHTLPAQVITAVAPAASAHTAPVATVHTIAHAEPVHAAVHVAPTRSAELAMNGAHNIVPFLLTAQASQPAVPAPPSATSAPLLPTNPPLLENAPGSSGPTIPSLVGDATKVYDDWQKLGWLAGLLALVNLLVSLMKFGPIGKWMEDNNKQFLRPYIALGLGAALGLLTALVAHVPIAQALGAGVLGGLAAVGLHEARTAPADAKKAG